MLKHLKKNHSDSNTYPNDVLDFNSLDLDAPVIFLTGSNGSGKSTILKVIAKLTDSIDLGESLSANLYDFDTSNYRIAWSIPLRRGYYFQSEDFYSYLLNAHKERDSNHEMLQEAESRHSNKQSMAYLLETGVHRYNTSAMDTIVQDYLKASHGEGYIRFFQSKLRPSTLYLLDEPETPLSFQNQLTLIKLIDDTVKKGSQFIICTHSPILLSYPNAKIYYLDDGIHEQHYEAHPIVQDYRQFLDNPSRYLHYLLEDE